MGLSRSRRRRLVQVPTDQWSLPRARTVGFLAPLPLVLSPAAALAWLGLAMTVAFGATLVPARRASALVIREALSRT